jgi:hypothetical protein
MVDVSPFVHPIPKAFLRDPETRAYFEYLNRFLLQLRSQSGDSVTNITVIEAETEEILDQLDNPEASTLKRPMRPQPSQEDALEIRRPFRWQSIEPEVARQARVKETEVEVHRRQRLPSPSEEAPPPPRHHHSVEEEAPISRREYNRLKQEFSNELSALKASIARLTRAVSRDKDDSSARRGSEATPISALSRRVLNLSREVSELSERFDVGV